MTLSLTSFYWTFLYVNDELRLIATSVTNYINGPYTLRAAVVNSGNRDVAVTSVKIVHWYDGITDETVRERLN